MFSFPRLINKIPFVTNVSTDQTNKGNVLRRFSRVSIFELGYIKSNVCVDKESNAGYFASFSYKKILYLLPGCFNLQLKIFFKFTTDSSNEISCFLLSCAHKI